MKPEEVCVFISSTWRDLRPERERVADELSQIAGVKIIGMEDFGSRDEDVRRASLDEVENSDIYLGIIGGRYGSGITEDEYNHASRLLPPLHRLIYIKDSAALLTDSSSADRPQLSRLEAFKAKVSRHTVSTFESPEQLAARASADIRRFLSCGGCVSRILPGSAFQLRQPVRDFVGRKREIIEMVCALRESGVCSLAITGMGGVGKTELALMIAEQLRADYRDAQLFVDMQGAGAHPRRPADALTVCLRSMLPPGADLPTEVDELASLYRAVLSGKRALIVLDNVANAAQARPMTPPPGCALIITSREVVNLEGTKTLTLGELPSDEARELLHRIAPRMDQETVDRICSLCGCLPLAIRAAGSLLAVHRDIDPFAYVELLQVERTRLGRVGSSDLTACLEGSFNLSYARLRSETALVFRSLSVFPVSFDEAAETEVCSDSDFNLSYLLNLSLVLFDETTMRYRLHDLIRAFAGNLVSANELSVASARHAGHYLKVARKIEATYNEGGESLRRGLNMFDLEWENLQCGHTWSASRSTIDQDASRCCTEYVNAVKYLLNVRKSPAEQLVWLESALTVARASGHRRDEGRYLSNVAAAHSSIGSKESALEFYEQALDIARATEDEVGAANALGGTGNVFARAGDPLRAIEFYHKCLEILYENNYGRSAGETLSNLANAYEALGDVKRAKHFYEEALKVAREVNNRRGEGAALSNLGSVCGTMRDTSRAIEVLSQSLALTREVGDRRSEAAVWNGLGIQYGASDRLRQAVECFNQSLAISREIGDRHCEAAAIGNLGNAMVDLGDPTAAIRFLEESLDLNRQLGHRSGEGVDMANLGNAYYRAGEIERAIEFHEKALTILQNNSDARAVANTLSNLGVCNAALGRHQIAVEYFEECLSVLDKLKDHDARADILVKMNQSMDAKERSPAHPQ